MKREGINHTKTKRLCRRLDIPLYQGVGILECLWKMAEREAPRGDIGKASNEEIALAIDWRGDDSFLVAALVECRLLEEHQEFRLVIHDWPDHCEDSVHMKLARSKQWFANGAAPKLGKLPKSEKDHAEDFYAVRTDGQFVRTAGARREHEMPVCAHGVRTNGQNVRLPSPIPIPSPLPLPSSPPKAKQLAAVLLTGWDSFIGRYPNQIKIDQACQDWISLCGKGEITESNVNEVLAGLDRWIASAQWAKEGGQFIPAPTTFLVGNEKHKGRMWKDNPPASEESKIASRRINSSSEGNDAYALWKNPYRAEAS